MPFSRAMAFACALAACLLPARLLADPGDVDLSFSIGTGPNAIVKATKVRTNDNKIYIGGSFDGYNGNSARRIARLTVTGAFDTTFVTLGCESSVNAIELQPDLKVVIGGDFTSVGNATTRRIARLNDNGSLDTTFTANMGNGPDNGVDALAVQADGKVVLAGRFLNFNGVGRVRIARVNADGTLDTSFVPGLGPNGPAVSIQAQTDGKIMVCGNFTSYNGVLRSGIVRLLTDGSVDTSFDPGTGAVGLVNGSVTQADGKIIVYGGINFFNGLARSKIVRLLANGTVDTPYAQNTAINSDIRDAQLLPSGKLTIVGVFFEINGISRRSVARLDLNGAHDTLFNPGTAAGYLDNPANAAVNASALDTEGKLFIAGEFRQFNQIPFNFITRVGTADPTPPLVITHPTNVFILTGSNASFFVTASGTAPLNFQWRFNGVNILNATNSSITITNAQNANVGLYSAVVANSAGTATSSNASLTLGTFPFFVTPPASQTNFVGANSNFTVTAGGTTPLFYQWVFGGAALAGQTNPVINLTNIQIINAGLYTIIVSNQFGAVTNSATLTVAAPPAIVAGPNGGGAADGQPQSLTVVQGQNATFSVNAVGSAPLTYQWRFAGANITGATNTSVTLTNVLASQAGLYSVVISNPFGTTTSANATLTVLLPPTITVQPVSQTLTQGATLNLSVTATGSPTLVYQWRLNGAIIPGATLSVLSFFNAQKSLEGNYTVVVSNPYGSVTSVVAVVIVQLPPAIADNGQPQPQTVIQGSNATFSVTATGDPTLTYQWRFGGTNIAAATANPLILLNVQTNQAGNYSVVVSNPFGSVTSSNALLTVRVPPFIIVQPAPGAQTVIAGTSPTITVVAGGDPTLTYQWRLNGTNVPGAIAATLTLANVQTNQLGTYSVVVSNPYGTVTSANATLDVKSPPFVATQPQSLTVLVGSPASFSVTAGGDGPFTYQWRFAGANIPGATTASFGYGAAQTNNAGLYSVVITSPYGSVPSSNATLTVNVPPTIVVPPASQSVVAGANVTFTVTATGDAPLTYQWRFNGVNIAGGTGPTLSFFNVQESLEGNFTVVVSNPFGTVTSTVAVLTVQSPPAIADNGQPQPQTVIQGSNATFSVTATGDPTLTYQWRFGGTNIAGGTNNPLVLTAVQTNQAGNYSVVVSNPFGTVTSSNALLTVRVPPFIITQPAPATQTVVAGSSPTITVLAGGDPTLTYQWRLNGVNVAGATAATLTLAAVQVTQLGTYTVVVSNPYGTVTSANATLDVKTGPFVATQPQSLAVLVGSPASFSVTAGGDGPFTYQWRFAGVNITGATNASVGLGSARTNDAGLYSVVISSPYGSITSANATLTVNVPPTIIVQPLSQSNVTGANVVFSVVAVGDAPLSYQWRRNGTAIAGATSAILSLTNVQAAQAGDYTVVVSNPFGTATSVIATLTLKAPPFVATQPQSLTVLKGTNASFSVTAGGDGPFTYQWRFAGVNIPGATNATVTLTNVQTNQAGLYSAVIASPYGSATSSNATLTVLDPPVIIVQPVSVSVLAGDTAAFTVVAIGRPTLLYQWCKNGVNIVGATSATFSLVNVSASDVANYCVKVTNADGSVTSVTVTLSLALRTLQVVTTQTTNFPAGTAISVPIALLADGGENRARGSISYDTNKLTFVSVTSPFTTALLSTTNATTQGQIGFDFTLPGGQTFSAGSNAIVFVNFIVGASVTQSIASVMLQGVPVTNQVLNVAGSPLPSYFLSGAVIFKSLTDYTLRSQTGATEEALPILNPAGSVSSVSFVRISFFDLGKDSLGNAIFLINATGTNNGVPFILLPTTVAPAGTFPLNVEYYVSDRVTAPKPRLVVEVVTGGYPVAPAGTLLTPDRAEFHLGRFKIDYMSTAGKTYYIQYSASALGPYETSFPGIAGTGGRLQWVDTGPPRTSSLPTGAGARFYRLLQVP